MATEYTGKTYKRTQVAEAMADLSVWTQTMKMALPHPRNLSCPSCGRRNVLTPADRARGYQCNACADRDEGITMDYNS